MAQAEVYVKNLDNSDWRQPATIIAACKNHEGFLIIEAASYIIRAQFTEQETREIAVKFIPPIR